MLLEINLLAKQKKKFTYVCKAAVGSRYICNPPPEDTDVDTLFFVKPGLLTESVAILIEDGWMKDGGETYKMNGDFVSLRKDNQNYILTECASFFDKFVTAAKICKELNVLDKAKRVLIHEMVMELD